ncbi:MAG: porin family protein [Flavisolibacter sp.]
MKTKLSVLFVCVLLAQASFAQFRLGIKGGANFTKVDGKSFRDEFRYGYHLGGFAEIGLGKKLAIQPEVLFNQYQSRADSSFENVYQNSVNISNYQNVKLNYLSIPLMLNYKVGKVLTLQAGPQFGILLDQSKNLLENGEEAFSGGDFSMAGGAVINISKLRLTGRYFVGLNNISEINDQNKWKNQGFQVSVGFSL